jgi:hypothetical protein
VGSETPIKCFAGPKIERYRLVWGSPCQPNSLLFVFTSAARERAVRRSLLGPEFTLATADRAHALRDRLGPVWLPLRVDRRCPILDLPLEPGYVNCPPSFCVNVSLEFLRYGPTGRQCPAFRPPTRTATIGCATARRALRQPRNACCPASEGVRDRRWRATAHAFE